MRQDVQMTRPVPARTAGWQVPVPAREVPLVGGRLTSGVVRLGATVRRPVQPQSGAVADYLEHLERVGFEGSPRYFGRDGQGRDVLTYIDGDVAGDPLPRWAADDRLLASVARLLRRLHRASAGYRAEAGFAAPRGTVWRRDLVRVDLPDPEPEPELISHLDVVPGNVVVQGGEAVALIDFDLAGPTTRLLNVYATAAHWVPLCPRGSLPEAWRDVDQARRLRIFATAYGLPADLRASLVDFGIARADVTWRRLKASAEQLGGGWARMWDDGVGRDVQRRKAWLTANRSRLIASLT